MQHPPQEYCTHWDRAEAAIKRIRAALEGIEAEAAKLEAAVDGMTPGDDYRIEAHAEKLERLLARLRSASATCH